MSHLTESAIEELAGSQAPARERAVQLLQKMQQLPQTIIFTEKSAAVPKYCGPNNKVTT